MIDEKGLLEAFRKVGPPKVGEPERISRAAGERLARLAKEYSRDHTKASGFHHDKWDASSAVVLRLLESGTDHLRPQTTDKGALWYLLRSFHNQLVSNERATNREVPAVENRPDKEPRDYHEDPEESSERVQIAAEAQRAEAALFEGIVPTIARSMKGTAGERFVATIAALRRIRNGEYSMDEWVDDEKKASPDRDPDKVRDDLDHRNSRALKRVFAYLQAEEAKPKADPDALRLVEQVVSSLRLRLKERV